MADNWSEKCCFKSRFGGGWISGGQYLAEGMCDRFARSQKQTLEPLFWDDPYWKKKFLLQLKHANDLLKEFDVDAIIRALRHPDCKRVYSLGLKNVIVPLAKREQARVSKQEEVCGGCTDVELDLQGVDVNKGPRASFSVGKSKLDRLRGLENG